MLCAAARQWLSFILFGYYAGRVQITSAVLDEIRYRTKPRAENSGWMQSAASEAVRVIGLRPSLVDDSEQYDAKIFDDVHRRLQSLAEAAGKAVGGNRHTGEAESIARCVALVKDGEKVIFLTNDTDASRVAAEHRIATLHFGSILQELVCAGRLDTNRASNLLQEVLQHSGINPGAIGALSCLASGGSCLTCDDLARRL
ncbi:hypothetical protein ACN27F_03330 [Solwaraspora sp. WMMB335]|uniref:hypothetical protein n=1 Tax=Solwaraspora sp. WMMB335 TaxID=3404118 RepID=UPI003B92D522